MGYVVHKWIFTIKYNPNWSTNHYKASLVAKGFTQIHGVNNQKTFTAVAKLDTVRVLLSLDPNLDRPPHQFDVKNAFFNRNLEEGVYMKIYLLGLRLKIMQGIQTP